MELEEIDSFVLGYVRFAGGKAFRTKHVEQVLHEKYPSVRDPMRVVDRSLQRLRKSGKIKLAENPRRWVIA